MPGRRPLLLALIILGLGISFVPDRPVMAQEEAAVAPEAEGEHAKAEPRKSYFWWFIESSGLIGLGLLILSIYFIQLVIRPQLGKAEHPAGYGESQQQKRQQIRRRPVSKGLTG